MWHAKSDPGAMIFFGCEVKIAVLCFCFLTLLFFLLILPGKKHWMLIILGELFFFWNLSRAKWWTYTIPETNIAPENSPLEKEIPIGNHNFLGGYASFREWMKVITKKTKLLGAKLLVCRLSVFFCLVASMAACHLVKPHDQLSFKLHPNLPLVAGKSQQSMSPLVGTCHKICTWCMWNILKKRMFRLDPSNRSGENIRYINLFTLVAIIFCVLSLNKRWLD